MGKAFRRVCFSNDAADLLYLGEVPGEARSCSRCADVTSIFGENLLGFANGLFREARRSEKSRLYSNRIISIGTAPCLHLQTRQPIQL